MGSQKRLYTESAFLAWCYPQNTHSIHLPLSPVIVDTNQRSLQTGATPCTTFGFHGITLGRVLFLGEIPSSSKPWWERTHMRWKEKTVLGLFNSHDFASTPLDQAVFAQQPLAHVGSSCLVPVRSFFSSLVINTYKPAWSKKTVVQCAESVDFGPFPFLLFVVISQKNQREHLISLTIFLDSLHLLQSGSQGLRVSGRGAIHINGPQGPWKNLVIFAAMLRPFRRFNTSI